jgi:hypothetical protein
MSVFLIQRFAPLAALCVAFLTATLACSAAALAQTPTSPSYRMPLDAVNNGIAETSSASYKLASSVGDTTFTARLNPQSAALAPGFWHAVIGATQGCVLDVDGNGLISATTDGLMILRAMLGLTDTAVTQGATIIGAPRTTWTQIAPYVHLAALNIDGSGNASAATDGVLLLRAMFGLTGTAVTNGVTNRTWADIRTYLNTQCGGSFAP